jgi:hypothetical protein
MWDILNNLVTKFRQPHDLLLVCICLFGLLYWKRLPLPFRWVMVCLWFNLLIEISSRIVAHVYRNNMPVLHLYTLGAFVLWSMFYRQVFGDETFFKRRFYWIVGSVSTVIVLNSALLQPLTQFNTHTVTLVQFIVIWYAVAYAFYTPDLLLEPTTEQKMLWVVNAAVLIYFCASLFIFMSGFLMAHGLGRQLLAMNKFFVFIFESLIFYALWRVIFNHKPFSSSSASASS